MLLVGIPSYILVIQLQIQHHTYSISICARDIQYMDIYIIYTVCSLIFCDILDFCILGHPEVASETALAHHMFCILPVNVSSKK